MVEYYLALKCHELSCYKEMWKHLKNTQLREAMGCLISTVWLSGKVRIMETERCPRPPIVRKEGMVDLWTKKKISGRETSCVTL